MRNKLQITLKLLIAIPASLPVRLARLLRHFPVLFQYLSKPGLYGIHFRSISRLLLWLGEIPFILLDILGLPEWYELGNLWFKPAARPLSSQELIWARSLFGENLPYWRIRVDERAFLGPKQYHFCYVSFCIVNSWEAMHPAVLIHELVHIWQFRRVGSVYILRALLAQRSRFGYDYGGKSALQLAQARGLSLHAFNYEQQAAIVEDYFRLQFKGSLRWEHAASQHDLNTYLYFVRTLSEIRY